MVCPDKQQQQQQEQQQEPQPPQHQQRPEPLKRKHKAPTRHYQNFPTRQSIFKADVHMLGVRKVCLKGNIPSRTDYNLASLWDATVGVASLESIGVSWSKIVTQIATHRRCWRFNAFLLLQHPPTAWLLRPLVTHKYPKMQTPTPNNFDGALDNCTTESQWPKEFPSLLFSSSLVW